MATTTGAALLPDVGQLQYNGVTFSSLYKSEINGDVTPDAAQRTTKFMTWILIVDGEVTLNATDKTVDATWRQIRNLLSVHGAPLIYRGNGFGGLLVNVPGGGFQDAAWGPIPKIINFRPLGAGRSAHIKWQVIVHVPQVLAQQMITPGPGGTGLGQGPVLQFNWQSTLTYDEDGYSGISIRGTLEIPLTRNAQNPRVLQDIVDNYRARWLDVDIDLLKFRVVRRNFEMSRDKRSMEWEFVAEELAPMGLPRGATSARGTLSVRPMKLSGSSNMPLNSCAWMISVRATYTISKEFPQRQAAINFYSLVWFRFHCSALGLLAPLNQAQAQAQQAQQQAQTNQAFSRLQAIVSLVINPAAGQIVGSDIVTKQQQQSQPKAVFSPYITDFGLDEGLYLDSKTITFQMSWVLCSQFQALLQATGVWRRDLMTGPDIWKASIKDVMGFRSYLSNFVDQNSDMIVDFGGGNPVPPRQQVGFGGGVAP